MPKNRIFIIIDGSNFYHRLKELQFKNLSNFNYGQFKLFLSREQELVISNYYIGAVKKNINNPKSIILEKNQIDFIKKLNNYGWQVKYGHMLKTDNVYREKGVDVYMFCQT